MKLLAVVTPSYIYHGWSNWKNFREETFTPGDLTAANIKHYGRWKVRKHRGIKNGEKYTTLEILLKFGSLDKMKITSLEPKYHFGKSWKGLITSLGLKTNIRSKKKTEMYSINIISTKDLSNIIKDFEKFPYKGYMWKRPKNKPTDSYVYLAR